MTAPFKPLNVKERRVEVEHRDDGSIILRNPHPMTEPHANIIAPIRKWAADAPQRTWLAERDGPVGWRHLSYKEGNDDINRIAQALIDRGYGPGGAREGALMILSGNSIEHALIKYAAILARVEMAPVSRSYSLMSSDFEKLKYVFDLIEPKIIFVQDGAMYGKALQALDLDGVDIVHVDNPPEGIPSRPFAEFLQSTPGQAVEDSYNAITFDTVAKYMFTSGSTGMPKAVINTHRMMCVNAAQARSMQKEQEDPPIVLSWLPWNHTFGANSVLHGVTTVGGTLYLDDGMPMPGFFEKTIRNLKEISPSTYSNVPAAFGVLLPELEKDEEFAAAFFKNLKSLSYGGAALAQDLNDRIQTLAVKHTGFRIPFLTGYGATETAPVVTSVHWATERMGLLGLPLPGMELKLAPVGDKLEVRVKGDLVTPGYYKRPDLTAKAFDEEGFYRLGDGAKFVDPNHPEEGLVFDGRVSEDFKLDTGTWVNAGKLRVQAIEASGGLMQDALVAGLDKPYVGILGFTNVAACRALIGDPNAAPEDLITNQKVLEHVAHGIERHNKHHPSSSTRIKRALLMAEPASMDAGELTDKGYINQGTSLARRKALVDKLYADPPGNDVIAL